MKLGALLLAFTVGTAHADRVDYFIGQLDAAGFKVRLQAAYILGTLKDRRAIPPLARALTDPHYAVRASAAISLGRLGEPLSAEPLLLAADDEEAWVRAEAVKALGRIGAKSALPRLVKALEDGDWKVRLEAVKALGRIGDKTAVFPLAQVIERGLESDELIDEARRSLRQLAAAVDVDEMLTRLKGGTDKHERARAALILGTLGERRAVPALCEALGDRESYVRWRVALALATMGDRRALDPLRQLLGRENDQRVRSAAELAVSRLEKK